MTKSVLLLGDVHLKTHTCDRIIHAECPDFIVCFGDIWDDFSDTVEENRFAALWLQKMLQKDNFICLWSNHMISYAYPNNLYTSCSGFEMEKSKAINSVLTKEDWNKLQWYYVLDDYICTHAGLSIYHLPPLLKVNFTIKDITDYLDEQIKSAEIALINNRGHWLYAAGRARYGREKWGGLTWFDWDVEFNPIENLNQIVGHTPHSQVQYKEGVNSKNWNLDTHLAYYGIWNGKKMEIKSYKDL